MTLSTSVPQQQRQKDAHAALVHLYEQHAPACFQLQRELLAAHPHASKYLSDPKNIFRFLKSSQFDLDEAARRVSKTLEWRSQQHFPPTANGLDLHAFRDRLSQLPTELQDMISVHTDATDLCGRPAAWLRLRSLRKISPATSSSSASVQHIGGMDALKSCFAEGLFEPMRMIMGQPQSGPGALQMALVVDLEGAGYANLVRFTAYLMCHGWEWRLTIAACVPLPGQELELVPWVLDTLKQHYPGLIGVGQCFRVCCDSRRWGGVAETKTAGDTVYLDNYSWLHSGLWSVFKRLMPQSALDKVVFTSSSQPLQAFLPDAAALSSLRHSLNADGRPLKRAAPASSLSDSTASFHSAHSAKDEMVRLAESTTASPPLASTVAPQLQQKPLRSVRLLLFGGKQVRGLMLVVRLLPIPHPLGDSNRNFHGHRPQARLLRHCR